MRQTCPECGADIPAENINIQQMAAVCPSCATVFRLEVPHTGGPKAKHRKVQQPEQVRLEETDHRVHLAFRTNFRLDQNEQFWAAGILSFIFASVTLLMTLAVLFDDAPAILPVIFGLATAFVAYWLLLIVFNRTHIDLNAERVRVERLPLRHPLKGATELPLDGVTGFQHEETVASQKLGYDNPRYRIRAQMLDGRQQTLLNDLTDPYATFVVQQLNEWLANHDTGLREDAAGEFASPADASDANSTDDERLTDAFSEAEMRQNHR